MGVVVGLTLIVSVIALLPVLHSMVRFPQEVRGDLWGYSPNQFLFLLVPFPIAAFTTFLSFRSILQGLDDRDIVRGSLPSWLVENWAVIILVGVMLVSVVTISDYFYTAKVFDRLEVEYAGKAVESADLLRERVERHLDVKDIKKERRLIVDEANQEFKRLSLSSRNPLQQGDILELPPPVYMKIVLDSNFQRSWKLLNPTAQALSILQLFMVLLTAFVAVFCVSVVYLSFGSQSNLIDSSINNAVDSLRFTVLSFSVYPICYRYFISEMSLITRSVDTIGGDVISALLILVSAGIILTVDPSRRDAIDISIRALPFLIVVLPGIYLSLAGPLALRNIIGIGASPGLRVTFLIVMFLFASVIVLSIWPRED
jgi:hypothetical protein